MRIIMARPMPNFSMDVYADELIKELRNLYPVWDLLPCLPQAWDRHSRSAVVRAGKAYERFWGFPQRVARQTADLFHIIDHSEAHIVRWLRKTGKPVVVTCHDLINYYYQQNLQGSVQVPLLSNGLWVNSVRAMQQADRVIAVSSATAQDMTRLLQIPPEKIEVIPNGVDAAFRPLLPTQVSTIRQFHHLTDDAFCILNVGSNHPRKNITAILKVIAILKQKNIPIQFWKVGANFTAAEQQLIQAEGITSLVRYLGNPDQSGLIELYNAADLLLAPSFHEGFGLTLLEAMACGTPVMTSNVSAMPEVVGEAGILVNPHQPEVMAETVAALIRDPQRQRELRQQGLARIQAFTWENNARKVAEIYQRLVDSRPLQKNGLDSSFEEVHR
jgi:glycosyltransferase involved in cell wall biosynthesis